MPPSMGPIFLHRLYGIEHESTSEAGRVRPGRTKSAGVRVPSYPPIYSRNWMIFFGWNDSRCADHHCRHSSAVEYPK